MSVKPAGDNPPDPNPDSRSPTPIQPDAPPADAKVYTESELAAAREEGAAALQTENEELKKTLQMRDAREEMTAALTKAGARSPECCLVRQRSRCSLTPRER